MKDPVEYARELIAAGCSFDDALAAYPFLSGEYGSWVRDAMNYILENE